jgi:hypothetical protein
MPPKSPLGFYDNRIDKGRTWTDGPGTSIFRCEVQIEGQRPLKVQLRAVNSSQAKAFAQRRWGKESQIKMLGKVR